MSRPIIEIAVVTGTSRPGTKEPAVVDWVISHARARKNARFTSLDIGAFDLPMLDEAVPRRGAIILMTIRSHGPKLLSNSMGSFS